ncbi:hypothetical protein GCM10009857_22310 [Agromyces soli]
MVVVLSAVGWSVDGGDGERHPVVDRVALSVWVFGSAAWRSGGAVGGDDAVAQRRVRGAVNHHDCPPCKIPIELTIIPDSLVNGNSRRCVRSRLPRTTLPQEMDYGVRKPAS